MHVRVPIVRWEAGQSSSKHDFVSAEEPLEIRLGEAAFTLTMRTPGHETALAAGLLFAEGVVRTPDEIVSIGFCENAPEESRKNMVRVELTADALKRLEAAHWERRLLSTSSCGICGKSSIEAAAVRCPPVGSKRFRVAPAALRAMPDRMREAQRTFHRTGGLHAAALFTPTGELEALYEDVGRHNALDKMIGSELLRGRVPLADRVLLVSGRTSFEIIQKAGMAAIPVVSAVSAPSSAAVALSQKLGITLIGFLRGESMNVYSCPERVSADEGPAHTEV